LLPRWPTFGINLQPYPDGFENEHVWLPAQTEDTSPTWQCINEFPAFIGAIGSTFHGWRDSLQTKLPAFRGRIAHVRQSKQEGGLNLLMTRETVAKMAMRGATAGACLRDTFSKPPMPSGEGVETTRHRWIRLRVGLEKTQELLALFADEQRAAQYATFLGSAGPDTLNAIDDAAADATGAKYRFPEEEVGHQRTEVLFGDLEALLKAVTRGGFDFAAGAPNPEAELRLLPPE
jgi:hypothetical protein